MVNGANWNQYSKVSIYLIENAFQMIDDVNCKHY